MKKSITVLSFALVLMVQSASAQQGYETSREKDGSTIYKGIISRQLIDSDTSFKWYATNFKAYAPNAETTASLVGYKDSIRLIAFMGTWCEDSHVIIPKFFSLLDASGFSPDRVTLIGTDRNKKTLGNLSESLNVTNVPTLIVMKNGKEVGRVVEYGKTGQWDKELGQIVRGAFSK